MIFFMAAAGLAMLIFGGDLLVRGASALSLRLGIPPLIIGLTIVAFGTSAPELLVSIRAVLADAPGLALGNVIGSNIANVLLVLGVPALICGLDGRESGTRESYLQMLGASLVFILLLFLGPLVPWHGLVLLALLLAMLAKMLRDARRARGAATLLKDGLEAVHPMPLWRSSAFLLVGIVALPIGAELLVDAARDLAESFGVSDEVVGLTLVAVGTSLPELATTVMAAIRRHAEVALGNVIGSNLFNILAIMGITSLFGPLAVDPHLLRTDIWVMLAAAVVLAPFVLFGRMLTRPVGVVFLLAYAAYTISLF